MDNNTCPFRKNIECSFRGALIFCEECGWYPPVERKRRKALESHSDDLQTLRAKNVIQLKIKHSGKRVSYNLQRVRKRTESPKTNIVLNNGQGDGYRPDQTRPDQTRPDQTRPKGE